MTIPAYTLAVLGLCVILIIFSYLDRVYRELGQIVAGRPHDLLAVFEAEIEPRIKLSRRNAALGFAILAQLSLVLAAAETARGVLLFVPGTGEAAAQFIVYLIVEVLVCAQLIPNFLVARTSGRWLLPLLPALWGALLLTWPLRAVLELAISVAHIPDEEKTDGGESQQEGIEALVEAAQEEGFLEQHEAQLIEQVVDFSDKRVLELMTPRPDIVSIPASATIEQLRRLLIETKFSRVLVYADTLDDVVGIVDARDLIQFTEVEAARRTVRELAKPALFVPETKFGSDLLKEMQRRNQHMAIAVDEHGLVAGIITVEDLVEEIVGEMGKEESPLAPDVVREPDGSMILRGSVAVGKLQELFGVELADAANAAATTVAGFLNSIAGHVPHSGEQIDRDGLHFEVVEANQRKVLRLRVRLKKASPRPAAAG
jgi:putative hemolysin